MTAHWVVLAAAALTTLVAAAVGAALAVFAGQALPRAVAGMTWWPRRGTALAANGSFGGGDRRRPQAALPRFGGQRRAGRRAVHFLVGHLVRFAWPGSWSVARPAGAVPPGSTPQLEAAALDGIASHAVSGRASPRRPARPAEIPRRAPRDQRRAAAPARGGRAPA